MTAVINTMSICVFDAAYRLKKDIDPTTAKWGPRSGLKSSVNSLRWHGYKFFIKLEGVK